MALLASPLRVVTTQSEPTSRPTACSTELAGVRGALVRFTFFSAWAKSVPTSSQYCRVDSVGLNLTRMGSNARL